jgi:hypothetical protein
MNRIPLLFIVPPITEDPFCKLWYEIQEEKRKGGYMGRKEKGERRKEKGERRKEKGERRKEKGERRKQKGERRKEKGEAFKFCETQHHSSYLRTTSAGIEEED